MIPDVEKIEAKCAEDGSALVKTKLANGYYRPEKKPVVENWLKDNPSVKGKAEIEAEKAAKEAAKAAKAEAKAEAKKSEIKPKAVPKKE